MKLLSLALFVLLGTATATENVSGKTLRADSHSSRKIMEHAVRVNRNGERILNEGQNNNFELTSAYSLHFDTCVALRTEPSETGELIFDQSLYQYASKGQLISQKSFILFNVCKTKYCDYYKSDDNLYMIDVDSYMSAISDYYVQRHDAYCDACVDSYNYCKYVEYQKSLNQNYNEYAGVDGYYSSSYYNNGGRELNRYQFEVIDCVMCSKMNCFTDYVAQQNGGNQAQAEGTVSTDLDSISEWVNELTACKSMGVTFLEYYALYAGFMCNQDGSGVDIAIFLDNECSIYTSHTAFTTIASDGDKALMSAAADMITYPFLHQINCNGNYAYYSMDEYRQQAQNYQFSNNNNDNNANPSDYCKAVFEGGDLGHAISLHDCDSDGEEDDRAEDADGVEVDEYVDNDYSWFTYTLSQEASQSTEETCIVIRKLQGEYETIYRWAGSGQLYNYGTGPSNKSSMFSADAVKKWFSQNGYNDKMSATLIVAISVAVGVAITALGCIIYSLCCPGSVANRYAEQKRLEEHKAELDAKRELLVNPTTGKLM